MNEKYKIEIKQVREWSPKAKDWVTRKTGTVESIQGFFESEQFIEWTNKNMGKPCKLNKCLLNEQAIDPFYETKDEEWTALAFKNFCKLFKEIIEVGE